MSKGAGEKLLDVQGALIAVIVGSGHRRIGASCQKVLSDMWSHDADSTGWMETSLAKGVEQNLQLLAVSSSYAEWAVRIGEEKRLEVLRKPMLTGLAKLVIGSKTKIEPVFLKVSQFT